MDSSQYGQDQKGAVSPLSALDQAALFLTARHSSLRAAVARLSFTDDEDGTHPLLDRQAASAWLNELARAFTEFDSWARLGVDYLDRGPGRLRWRAHTMWVAAIDHMGYKPEGGEAHGWVNWLRGAPRGSARALKLAPFSKIERAQLRVLATFSADRAPFTVGDLGDLDDKASQALLRDWLSVVGAQTVRA